MSVNDVRDKLEKLSGMYPNHLRVIRSPRDVDKLDVLNADMHGPFDNGDREITDTMESALSAGKQVAIQAAGANKLIVLTAKTGRKLFR